MLQSTKNTLKIFKVNFKKTHSSGLLVRIFTVASAALIPVFPSANAEAQETNMREDRPAMSAVRTASAPLLDGIISGDPAWKDIPSSTGFVQTTPAFCLSKLNLTVF